MQWCARNSNLRTTAKGKMHLLQRRKKGVATKILLLQYAVASTASFLSSSNNMSYAM